MRRMLRVMGWMGMGVSALLFVATIVMWVRSLRHMEVWDFQRFEPNPHWTTGPLAGAGTQHGWSVAVIRGQLWLQSGTAAPTVRGPSGTQQRRGTVTADEAKQNFVSTFQPGERPWNGGVERAWRFAGAGFSHGRSAVAPETGRVGYELFILALPFWMLSLLFALWPALFILRRLLRRKRFAQGLCQHCGYDLRATPDRCPECGRVVAAK